MRIPSLACSLLELGSCSVLMSRVMVAEEGRVAAGAAEERPSGAL